NSSTLYATAPSTGVSGIGSDGHVQVADFNLDGHPDLFISSRPAQGNSGTVYGYVWDVHNNTVSTPIAQAVSLPGKSIPLIADIDNDNVPEVVLHCGVSGANIRAYKYDAATRTFSLFWTKGFSEDSYSNSMTLFDFNQDGENELLICDNDMISIVNGSTPALAATAIYTYPFREVTIMQYPVIADIDNDGAAEIVFVGKQNSQSYQGTLNICRSNGDPWAPARPVWNQYMRCGTNICTTSPTSITI
ncbi:MAG: FG-GAP repeat/HVR domain protein, partial [bacterium F083]